MIKRIFGVAILQCCFVLPVCFAADSTASETSIRQLLEVMHVKALLDSMSTQMDGLMKNAMTQVTQGQQVTPEIQKEIEQLQGDVKAQMKSVLDWNKLEPMYVRIYQKSFNQQEIDGMLAFYKTPTGQSVLNKMPLVLQNTMAEVQQMLQPTMLQFQQKEREIAAKIQAKKNS